MLTMIQSFSAPLGRVLISLIFFTSGLTKITAYGQTAGWMESLGVPGILLPLVIILEILGPIAIILGWQTRIAAFLLAGFSILSALLFHNDFSNQVEMTNFMKNIAIAGGFLMITANGAGAYALDNRSKS